MNRPALIIAAVLALGLPALSAKAGPAAGAAAAFGNTVVTTDPDGRSRKIWLQPDGTWTGKSRRGLDLAGKWTERDDKVCLTQSKPRLFGSMCERFPSDPKVGIDAKDPTGKQVHLKLVKGHVE
jgi:hypothetical protein